MMEGVVPPGVLFAAIGVLTVMCLVPMYQCCASEPTKKQMKARLPVFIVLSLEIAYLITSYVSVYRTRKRRIKILSHTLIFCVLFVLSYVGFTVVEAPRNLKQASTINRVWTILTAAHICWLLFCTIVFFATEHIFWEHVYLVGLSVYIVIGALFLLNVVYTLRRTVAASINRFRHKSAQKLRQLPVAAESPPDTDLATIDIQLTPVQEEAVHEDHDIDHHDIADDDHDIINRIATDTLFVDVDVAVERHHSAEPLKNDSRANQPKPRLSLTKSLARLGSAKKKINAHYGGHDSDAVVVTWRTRLVERHV
mmetsp:Transcript_18205/g.28812  ORF Transcript_18205/g.28812 Transcript_18205/m.28812 type:complete len:310 (+) Transcript_18205:44-973(+)